MLAIWLGGHRGETAGSPWQEVVHSAPFGDGTTPNLVVALLETVLFWQTMDGLTIIVIIASLWFVSWSKRIYSKLFKFIQLYADEQWLFSA